MLESKDGVKVKPVVLKAVLKAIDDHGRGRTCYLAFQTIAAKSGPIGLRTAKRAVEVLLNLSVLIADTRATPNGIVCNHYTVVWSELERFCVGKRSAVPTDRSAVPTDRSAVPTDRSAVPTDRSAASGTQSDYEAPARSAYEAPSDVGDDGARYFFEDEVAAVRAKANELAPWAEARTLADRELVLKVATLWHDGAIPEDAVQQVLESYRRAKERREPVRNGMAWLWRTMREQCWRFSLKFEVLLVTTSFPRELLPIPNQREEQAT
jgi:hypothetical protein